MKANGAPEKLYLLPNGLISYHRNTNEDVEYTSTDAFIEKACIWFEHNLHMYNTSECLGDREEFVKDFKKAMNL